jgi:hypothetical protein
MPDCFQVACQSPDGMQRAIAGRKAPAVSECRRRLPGDWPEAQSVQREWRRHPMRGCGATVNHGLDAAITR